MTASTFDPVAFDFVISKEGGYDTDPRDRGNWTSGVIGQGELKGTKYGVAAHVYPGLDIKNLTLADAKAIQKRDYWDKVAGDQMPTGIDLSVFDMGYNAGPARSLKLLQAALDSAITTATGLAQFARTLNDKVAIIKKFSAKRLSFYQGLSTFATYGRGWSRRAAECEALSVKIAVAETKAPAEVKAQLQDEQKAANKSSVAHSSAAAATTTGDGAHAAQHSWAFDWLTAAEVALVAIIAIAIVYFVWKAVAHRDRAKAYAAQAASL
jgi:lysozyme family protein